MNTADRLRAHPFTAEFDAAHLALLAQHARVQQFARDAFILRQNQEIHDFHLLCEGRVMLQTRDARNRCIPVQTLRAGSTLGWSWLQPPYHSAFDARVLDAATTVAIDAAALRAAIEADHEFGFQFLQRTLKPLMSRLHACRMQLADVYAHPLESSR